MIAGFVFVLIPTTGEFITPLLVGGPAVMFGNSIQSFFSDTPNWNYGAVLACGWCRRAGPAAAMFGRYLATDLSEPETHEPPAREVYALRSAGSGGRC